MSNDSNENKKYLLNTQKLINQGYIYSLKTLAIKMLFDLKT